MPGARSPNSTSPPDCSASSAASRRPTPVDAARSCGTPSFSISSTSVSVAGVRAHDEAPRVGVLARVADRLGEDRLRERLQRLGHLDDRALDDQAEVAVLGAQALELGLQRRAASAATSGRAGAAAPSAARRARRRPPARSARAPRPSAAARRTARARRRRAAARRPRGCRARSRCAPRARARGRPASSRCATSTRARASCRASTAGRGDARRSARRRARARR